MRKKLLLSATLMFFCVLQLMAQKTVKGKITDIGDKPISNASVIVRGANVGTNTDDNGEFTLVLPKGKSSLTVSSVGFESRDVSVTGDVVHVTLSSRVSTLNDVIVTGYGSQRKKDITGSVAVVNVSNLKVVPSGTAESLLQGQASGVTIINSGSPGGGSNVRIRGITSIGSTDPLVIIDGTPGSMHDLNVNDIESIQVLKDAGAAAIYGVRGSNGVIVVTTKKGKTGKPKVSYHGYVGNQVPTSGNALNTLNSSEYASMYKIAFPNTSLFANTL